MKMNNKERIAYLRSIYDMNRSNPEIQRDIRVEIRKLKEGKTK
jgi:hypothetical protein